MCQREKGRQELVNAKKASGLIHYLAVVAGTKYGSQSRKTIFLVKIVKTRL